MTTQEERSSAATRGLRQRSIVALASVFVGIVAGLAAIAFRESFAFLQTMFFGARLSDGIYVAHSISKEMLLLVPVLGGVVMALIAHFWLPSRRPQGVPDVVLAANESSSPLNVRTGLIAAAASAVSLGTGGPVGREGPMVHLGATIGAWVARSFGLSNEELPRIVAWGVAAGVAASFNAPIAGAIFAAEVVLGSYKPNTFAPLALASVTGTIVSRLYFGELNEFSVPTLFIRSYAEVPSFLLFGVACALVSFAFILLPSKIHTLWAHARIPAAIRPAFAGVFVGLIAFQWPEVLGVGYETTSLAIAGKLAAATALAIAIAKLIASCLYFGSGWAGGIFSPSIMIGAMLGSAWGAGVALVFPEIASSTSTYALVGMGAVAAATLGAPLSTVVIIFELTGNYPVTLAVLLATLVCSVIVNQLWGYSYFTWQLAQRKAEQASN